MYIPIILGTSREGRQSEKVSTYLFEQVSKTDLETKILDVKNYHFHATDNSEKIEMAKKWKEEVMRADGYIIVSPEYNHGYPGELKMVLDLVYGEYDKKPVGICGVSNGSMAGGRVVEQLRMVAIALRMVPINAVLHFPHVSSLFDESGLIKDEEYAGRTSGFLEELTWYASALKVAREK